MSKITIFLFFIISFLFSCSSKEDTNTSIKIIFESPETIGDVKFIKQEVLKTQGDPVFFDNQEIYMSKRIKSYLLSTNEITEILVKPNPYIPNEIRFKILPNVCNVINLSQDTLMGSLFSVQNAEISKDKSLSFVKLDPNSISIIEQRHDVLLFDKHIGVPKEVHFLPEFSTPNNYPTIYQLRKSQDFREYIEGVIKNGDNKVNDHYLR